MLEAGACSQCAILFHLPNIRVAGAEVFRIIQESGTLLHRYPRKVEGLPLNLLNLMKPKKNVCIWHLSFNNTLNRVQRRVLPAKKRKAVAGNSTRCGASSFFFPIFVPHSTDSTKSTVESVSGIMAIMPDSVTEATVMYGGVASGTKIRIIRIYGRKPIATPPSPNRKAE